MRKMAIVDQTARIVPAPFRRWIRRIVIALPIVLLILVTVGRSEIVGAMRHPSTPFDVKAEPPPPDYSQQKAWMAFPGRRGLERSVPPGYAVVGDEEAPADVFFIHPTTYRDNDIWNAPYDAPDSKAPLNPPVLLEQLSVFNGCCRMYAPHYRQATLAGLSKSQPAMDLAYSDVLRAFRFYIAHVNKGRPFIVASHSQGTAHAVRLLQDEIIGTPLQSRLVVAYLVGGYVPSDFAKIGMPACEDSRQIDCVLSWNTIQAGRNGARMLIDNKTYYWQGKMKDHDQAPAICVNPLTWNETGSALAQANSGSVPFPKAPFPVGPSSLPLFEHLTGAVCHGNLLEVDIPRSSPRGFRDILSLLFGSYHLSDYGIFYAAIYRNAIDRVNAWKQRHNSTRLP
ncbi:DUF3089 domain-containing protein [Sphingomonas sp. CGMCC 1.13654]|uniref:DUF3089 domain-containing protein n=1 Tax=Sphingomonas chungangi TaxID=2683589 RepID=A0A838L6H7_9SPHN|nr:DUF3089 domain-containing protein [Sphingomonas chungangi]MBA2934069.1 DUF3089 domain-containing protein [Sphingomonas chungangi]